MVPFLSIFLILSSNKTLQKTGKRRPRYTGLAYYVNSPFPPGRALEELYPIHSFIIKIWLEEPDEETQSPTWRGHITHVPSGERHYIAALTEISAFITPHLKKMGVPLDTPDLHPPPFPLPHS